MTWKTAPPIKEHVQNIKHSVHRGAQFTYKAVQRETAAHTWWLRLQEFYWLVTGTIYSFFFLSVFCTIQLPKQSYYKTMYVNPYICVTVDVIKKQYVNR